MKKLLSLSLIFLFAFSSLISKEDSIILKLNFEKGQKIDMEMSMDMKMDMFILGQTMDMDMKMKNTQSLEVLDIDSNSNFLLNFDYGYFDYEMSAMNQTINLNDILAQDSSVNQKNPLSALEGINFKVLISPSGKVQEIFGYDEYMDGLMNKLEDPETKMKMQQVMSQLVNEDMFTNNTSYLTGKEISIGDSVVVDFSMLQDLGIDLKTVYILKKFDENFAYFDSKIVMNFDKDKEGVKIKMNMEDLSSELIVDRKTAWIHSQKSNGVMSITIGSDQDTSREIKMNSTIKSYYKQVNK